MLGNNGTGYEDRDLARLPVGHAIALCNKDAAIIGDNAAAAGERENQRRRYDHRSTVAAVVISAGGVKWC